MNWWRRLRRAPRPSAPAPALILMYHRVAPCEWDPWELCVAPASFDRQLHWLAQHCRVVPLRQLAAELDARQLRERTVAITFDDGYADNWLCAAPLLARHALPATFFLTTGALGTGREFWWDELERLLLIPTALPGTLQVQVGDTVRAFRVGRAAEAPAVPPRESQRPWTAPAGTRLHLYYAVWKALRPLDEESRQQALGALREQVGLPDAPRETHRPLEQDEARRLAATAGVDVGAHSVTHPPLSERRPEEQRFEMRQSKQDLEALTGRPVVGFAYPYGDIGPESARIARETGFAFACSTAANGVTRDTPLHLLPRVAVGDWTEQAFAARIGGLLA